MLQKTSAFQKTSEGLTSPVVVRPPPKAATLPKGSDAVRGSVKKK